MSMQRERLLWAGLVLAALMAGFGSGTWMESTNKAARCVKVVEQYQPEVEYSQGVVGTARMMRTCLDSEDGPEVAAWALKLKFGDRKNRR